MSMQEHFDRYARYNSGEQICINESIASDPIIDLHTHDFMELSYIQKGHATHVINGSRISLSEGDMFLLAYGCEHTFESYSHDFTWMNCLFLPQVFDAQYQTSPFLEDLYQLPYFKKAFDFRIKKTHHIHLYQIGEELENDFQSLFQEYYNGYPGYHTICVNALANLLIKIGRTYMRVSHTVPKNTHGELVDIVQDYFKLTSSYQKIRLEDIAQRVYLHPDYLAKLFKKNVGINLSTFIRNLRLEYAAQHLRYTNMNVCEIMRFVGYQDTKNFYKAFKEVYHLTPAQYRKQNKTNAAAEGEAEDRASSHRCKEEKQSPD